jgi:hypothetical protein
VAAVSKGLPQEKIYMAAVLKRLPQEKIYMAAVFKGLPQKKIYMAAVLKRLSFENNLAGRPYGNCFKRTVSREVFGITAA